MCSQKGRHRFIFSKEAHMIAGRFLTLPRCEFPEMSTVWLQMQEGGSWGRKEGGEKRQAIKSPSFCLLLMTDLGSGLPSLSCSHSEEKHGRPICRSPGFNLVAPNHLSFLVFQQEEECQRILQPAEGKRLSKRPLLLSAVASLFSMFSFTLPYIKTSRTFRLKLARCCVYCRCLVVAERWTHWKRSWRKSWSSALRTWGATRGTMGHWAERCSMDYIFTFWICSKTFPYIQKNLICTLDNSLRLYKIWFQNMWTVITIWPFDLLTCHQAVESLFEKDGDFLVRDSSSAPGDYVLSCFWKNEPMHFKIIRVVLRPKKVHLCVLILNWSDSIGNFCFLYIPFRALLTYPVCLHLRDRATPGSCSNLRRIALTMFPLWSDSTWAGVSPSPRPQVLWFLTQSHGHFLFVSSLSNMQSAKAAAAVESRRGNPTLSAAKDSASALHTQTHCSSSIHC